MPGVANYLQRDSWVHRLNPLTKLFWSLVIMFLSFFYKDPRVLAILFLSIGWVAYHAKILPQMLPVFKGLLYFALFFVAFQIFFITEGHAVVTLIPGLGWLQITDQGLWVSLAMGIRVMLIASGFPVLLATTQVTDLVVVLVEKLKIPYTYAFMFVTTLRFIPTFMNEMEQIIQAQCSRGHQLNSRNFITKFLSICPLAIPLMITSIKKAERLAISMETRGFGLGGRTYLHRRGFSRADWLAGTTLVLIIAVGILLRLKGILV